MFCFNELFLVTKGEGNIYNACVCVCVAGVHRTLSSLHLRAGIKLNLEFLVQHRPLYTAHAEPMFGFSPTQPVKQDVIL